MNLIKIGLLTLSITTFINAELMIVDHKPSTSLRQAKTLMFTPTVKSANGIITIAPKENEQVSDNGDNVSNYVSNHINNHSLKINNTTINFCGQNTYIVTVGINYYKHDNLELKNAVKDTKKVTRKLVNGCKSTQTHLMIDNEATQKNILNRLKKVMSKATEKDSVIFLYSGNGFSVKNQNYLIPFDAKHTQNINNVLNTYLSTENIKKIFNSKKINKGLMIFDACTTPLGLER